MREQKKWLLRLLVAVFVFGACLWQMRLVKQVLMPIGAGEVSFILDAGHGGEDGGAVSPGGVKESELNLKIVLRMEQMMAFLGDAPLLLREEDRSLHEEEAKTLREKKVSDLKYRVSFVSEHPKAALVSVHQNTYPEPQYRGAQVFYAPTGGSQALAETVQRSLAKELQPDNRREEKTISDGVYLMNHIENCAILVECGFLTNPEEEQLLCSDAYQKKLAMVLGSALIRYVGA